MEPLHDFFWNKLESDLSTVVPNYIRNGFQ